MGNTQTIMVGKGLSVFEGVEDREFDEWGEPVGYYVLWGNYQDFAGMDSEQHKGLERMYAIRGCNRAIANFHSLLDAIYFAKLLSKSIQMDYTKGGIMLLHEDRTEWLGEEE